jgi:hypothetical protein
VRSEAYSLWITLIKLAHNPEENMVCAVVVSQRKAPGKLRTHKRRKRRLQKELNLYFSTLPASFASKRVHLKKPKQNDSSGPKNMMARTHSKAARRKHLPNLV